MSYYDEMETIIPPPHPGHHISGLVIETVESELDCRENKIFDWLDVERSSIWWGSNKEVKNG